MAMAERKNIEFGVEGGVTLRGWLFVPGAKGPAPAITMAHGRFPFSRASPKLIPFVSASGAPAMPGATRLWSVLRTGG